MLHFSYGVMGSSKSAMLLMQRYNHLQLGHYVVLIKPAIDTRIDASTVYSRVGLQAQALPWITNSIALVLKQTSLAISFLVPRH